ncbi:MAG TPA: hypothetical protein VGH28_27010 [Polyangiaceae bacterium]
MRFAAFALVVFVACGSSHPPTATLPPQPSSSATPPKPVIAATPAAKHELKRVECKYSVEKLPSTTVPFDVELRGDHDAALLASILAATRGWTHAHLETSPTSKRFAIVGVNASTATAFVLFDEAGKKLVSHVADAAFFGQDGDFLYVSQNRIYAGDGSRALGGVQTELCLERTCKTRTFPIAATAGATKILVSRRSNAFVQGDDLFVLDPMTGAAAPLVAASKTTAFLGGTLLSTGAWCTYEMPYSRGDEPVNATLECAAPPWTAMKSIFVHEGGGMYVGAAGARVVTGLVGHLDVMDVDGTNHASYDPPLRGLPNALGDGRTVAIEGDDSIALVDVIDETYALVTGTPTVVVPLAGHAKAFIATGDGTASLVRYE